jgi:hypothetical protein
MVGLQRILNKPYGWLANRSLSEGWWSTLFFSKSTERMVAFLEMDASIQPKWSLGLMSRGDLSPECGHISQIIMRLDRFMQMDSRGMPTPITFSDWSLSRADSQPILPAGIRIGYTVASIAQGSAGDRARSGAQMAETA